MMLSKKLMIHDGYAISNGSSNRYMLPYEGQHLDGRPSMQADHSPYIGRL